MSWSNTAIQRGDYFFCFLQILKANKNAQLLKNKSKLTVSAHDETTAGTASQPQNKINKVSTIRLGSGKKI